MQSFLGRYQGALINREEKSQHCVYHNTKCAYKGRVITVTTWTGPEDSRIPRISIKSSHGGGKVVSFTHRTPLLAHEIFLVLFFFRVGVDPRTIVRPEGLRQRKNPSDPIGNRSRNLPVCSTALQPTAPRVPQIWAQNIKYQDVGMYSRELQTRERSRRKHLIGISVSFLYRISQLCKSYLVLPRFRITKVIPLIAYKSSRQGQGGNNYCCL
jgi:hypothetical protein